MPLILPISCFVLIGFYIPYVVISIDDYARSRLCIVYFISTRTYPIKVWTIRRQWVIYLKRVGVQLKNICPCYVVVYLYSDTTESLRCRYQWLFNNKKWLMLISIPKFYRICLWHWTRPQRTQEASSIYDGYYSLSFFPIRVTIQSVSCSKNTCKCTVFNKIYELEMYRKSLFVLELNILYAFYYHPIIHDSLWVLITNEGAVGKLASQKTAW